VRQAFSFVMAGLVPAIHVFGSRGKESKTWMAGMKPAMTVERVVGWAKARSAVPTRNRAPLLGGHASLCPPYED